MKARENPFRTERLERLAFRVPRSEGPSWAGLEALNYHAAIIGPHGTGKTTLLREVSCVLRAGGMETVHWFLSEDRPNPSVLRMCREARALGPQQVLLFDGAGHLNRMAWAVIRQSARSAGGLIITDHAPGRLPTWVETVSDAALLRELTAELLEGQAELDPQELEALRLQFGGNLREVFLELFDLSARDAWDGAGTCGCVAKSRD